MLSPSRPLSRVEEFTHIILTRFNVRMRYSGQRATDEEWLEHRFKLFDVFCFPSMRSQTNQDFKWLVFFDASTSESWRRQIDEYAKWDSFVPCYVEDFQARKMEAIAAHIRPGTKYLITTRLDNDDAVSRGFVETIHRHFRRQDFGFLNFTNGLMLSTERNALYRLEHRSNPFVSLIEKADGFRSVWCGVPHDDYETLGPIEQIGSEPAWLMVVHGRNVVNKVRNEFRVPLEALSADFVTNYQYNGRFEKPSLIALRNSLCKLRYMTRKWRSSACALGCRFRPFSATENRPGRR